MNANYPQRWNGKIFYKQKTPNVGVFCLKALLDVIRNFFFQSVPPLGLEPKILGPKPSVISVSLQGRIIFLSDTF